jgi:hypothetical protein
LKKSNEGGDGFGGGGWWGAGDKFDLSSHAGLGQANESDDR